MDSEMLSGTDCKEASFEKSTAYQSMQSDMNNNNLATEPDEWTEEEHNACMEAIKE